MEKGKSVQVFLMPPYDINVAFFMIDTHKTKADLIVRDFATGCIKSYTDGIAPRTEVLRDCFTAIMIARRDSIDRGDPRSTIQFISHVAAEIARQYIGSIESDVENYKRQGPP